MYFFIKPLIAIISLSISIVSYAADYPILKITKQNKSIFLIGSSHIGSEQIQNSVALDSIIEKSEAICLEYDPNDIDSIRRSKEAIALNPLGVKLKERIGVALYEKIKARMNSNVNFMKRIDVSSPFAVSGALLSTALEVREVNTSYQFKYSLDGYIRNLAKKKNIPIRAIEDNDALANEFSKISNAQWMQYLSGTMDILDCPDCIKRYVANLKIAYTPSADFEHAYRYTLLAMSESSDLKMIFEKIFLEERNNKMAQNIETQAFQDNKCTAIAVGGAHLGGKKGLVSLLRQRGFIVEDQENN